MYNNPDKGILMEQMEQDIRRKDITGLREHFRRFCDRYREQPDLSQSYIKFVFSNLLKDILQTVSELDENRLNEEITRLYSAAGFEAVADMVGQYIDSIEDMIGDSSGDGNGNGNNSDGDVRDGSESDNGGNSEGGDGDGNGYNSEGSIGDNNGDGNGSGKADKGGGTGAGLAGRHREVEAVKKYIYDHYGENLSVDTLAQSVYLSAGYLSHVFKKETGQSISRFIRAYRMEKATEMLENTYCKIAEISSAVGYTSVSYFCQSFRECFGVSPQKYRNRYSLQSRP